MGHISKSVANFKESIFTTISLKAQETKALNLGQGFPDFNGPEKILEDIKSALDNPANNQYAPSPGKLSLREEISKYYKSFYDLNYDPGSEITVTSGATEGIFCSALAFLDPEDEVVLIEPSYDSYASSIDLTRATKKYIKINLPDYKLDPDEVSKAFSKKTKLLILNSPHNPTGKVFNKEEMELLAKHCIENDVLCLSDEVYEFLTFDNYKHIPLASIGGMKERTITVSSFGKTFGFTGFKLGWACAPKNLSHAIRMVHQYSTFSGFHPVQEAAAKALVNLADYIPEFRQTYESKLNLLINGLNVGGYSPIRPQGTYFVLAKNKTELNDIDYCLKLMEDKGVASIPLSPFYHDGYNSGYIRFCFAKSNDLIKKATDQLI